ncbi:hypothetical protein, partial [Glutamicibacter protophormiae]|uniref:hypothetical protein n=1 Tax=Glutamicibacter protophormiae TaxID=37930 RepID=UPI003A8EED92
MIPDQRNITVVELEDLAFELRAKLLHLCGTYEGAVHIGGDLSAAGILTALFAYGLGGGPAGFLADPRDHEFGRLHGGDTDLDNHQAAVDVRL